MSSELIRAARGYVQLLGFELLVTGADKLPASSFFPHGVSSATQDLGLLTRAIQYTPGAMLAAKIGRRLVLDVDVRHDGFKALEKLPAMPTTWMQRTATSGLHVWFDGLPPGEYKGALWKGGTGHAIDALRGNHYVILSPSSRVGGRYEWTQHPLRTPLASPPGWVVAMLRREEQPSAVESFHSGVGLEFRIKRARAYLEHADGATSGQHGHTRTFWVAQVVTRGFDVPEAEAFTLLSEWNQRCDPPWNDHDLKRKIKQARERGDMTIGKMLAERSAA